MGDPVEIAEGLLSSQLGFIADGSDRLPASATDDFSLGYLAGFLDAMMQRDGIGDEVESFATVSILMMKLFGEKAVNLVTLSAGFLPTGAEQ